MHCCSVPATKLLARRQVWSDASFATMTRRAVKARLVIVANDASDHTWRRAKSFVAGTEQQCIRVPFSKEELGFVVGRTSLAIAAFTDAALALAFVKATANPQAELIEALEAKAKRLQSRQQEAKAHQRNVRKGKK